MKNWILFILFLPTLLAQIDERDRQSTSGQSHIDRQLIGGLSAVDRQTIAGGSPTEVSETFEASEYDESWTESGTPNGDDTAPVLGGTRSLNLDSNDYIQIAITDRSFYQLDFTYHPATAPNSASTIIALRTSGGSPVCMARSQGGGTAAVYAGASPSDSSATADSMSGSTTYYGRLIWNSGGTCSIELNATGVFNGSGDDYTSKTGGTQTIGLLRVGHSTNAVASSNFDDISLTY